MACSRANRCSSRQVPSRLAAIVSALALTRRCRNRRQTLRVALAVDDRPQDLLPGLASNVGEHRVQQDIHLGQRLLHVLHAARAVFDQPLCLAHVGTKRTDRIARTEGTPQKAVGLKLPDPLAVEHIALAPGNLLRHAGRHQHHLEPGALQHLVDRDPVHRGRFHRHFLHPARRQPGRHRLQIPGEAVERPDRFRTPLRIDRHEVPVLANVDPGTVRVHHLQPLCPSSFACHARILPSFVAVWAGRNHGEVSISRTSSRESRAISDKSRAWFGPHW